MVQKQSDSTHMLNGYHIGRAGLSIVDIQRSVNIIRV